MFTYQHKIKLHETDAAGLLFFSEQTKIMHDAYEALLENLGFGFAELISNQDFFLPIVHVEADYKKPLFVGDLIELQVIVDNIGETSFTFSYQILNTKKETVGFGKTVHVTMDKKSQSKIPLPKDMRQKLSEL
jgi:1,4-dihydroxy-2-naphthoyl-CoA hydrolase